MKILMTGATGLVGKELGKYLALRGHQIYVISRDKKKAELTLSFPAVVIEADLSKGPLQDIQAKMIEAVIHLAGENIGKGRWTKKEKQKIYSSRASLTKNLVESFRHQQTLKVFVSASATGFYGDRGNEFLTEDSERGTGFLSDVCEAWEKPVRSLSCRYVILRTAVVLSPLGGALMKIILPFRFGLGGALGSGKQWVPWIHLDDLVRLYETAVTDEKYDGVYNAAAPETVTNRQMSQAIAIAMKTKLAPAVPQFVLKLALGEMSHLLLDSAKVSASKLQKAGFQFKYNDLLEAIRDACSKKLN